MFSTLILSILALSTAVRARAQLLQLKLPWGTWEGTPYPQDPNIYLFKNVRFGAQPERFGLANFPDWENDTVQAIPGDLSCLQINTSQLKNPPGGRNPIGAGKSSTVQETEDCLFLDMYVPATAFEPDAPKVPVVVWLHGGAYALGSKNQIEPLYTGQSVIAASDYQTIFVTGNYRVGALGWLAGSYMEEVAQPNAGLHDQELVFEWVQEYIELVGGDKDQVSAWGESAGAGSILHHLIRMDGTLDPLFKTFVAQSPTFEWAWDNSVGGKLDHTFATFSEFAKCGDYDISCLRKAGVETIAAANQGIFDVGSQTGLFSVGPAVDGKWIKTIPALALSQNKVWPGVQSGIIAHCGNEAYSFVPKGIDTQNDFDIYLATVLPGDELYPQRDAVKQQYNCYANFGGNFTKCVQEVIQDFFFSCNTRQLFDAYPNISYMMEYDFPLPELAIHGSDLIPLFSNNKDESTHLLAALKIDAWQANLYADLLDTIKPRFQNYFASFALAGDPNALPFSPSMEWPIADGSEDKLANVLKVTVPLPPDPGFKLGADEQNSKSKCDFWVNIAKSIDLQGAKKAAGIPGNRKILLTQDSGSLTDL